MMGSRSGTGQLVFQPGGRGSSATASGTGIGAGALGAGATAGALGVGRAASSRAASRGPGDRPATPISPVSPGAVTDDSHGLYNVGLAPPLTYPYGVGGPGSASSHGTPSLSGADAASITAAYRAALSSPNFGADLHEGFTPPDEEDMRGAEEIMQRELGREGTQLRGVPGGMASVQRGELP